MAAASSPGDPVATHCARHPTVETYLHCGRCDTPICPRCLVQTPVGTRCRDCARLRPSPPYDIGPAIALRGGGAALGTALVGGVVAQFLGRLGLLGMLLGGFFLGVGVARVIELATNRKRGPVLGWLAVVATVIGYGLGRSALVYLGLGSLREPNRLVVAFALGFQPDLNTLLLLLVASVVAFGRLR